MKRFYLAVVSAVAALATHTSALAQDVWSGGTDGYWGTAANWVGGAAPINNTNLAFTGTTRQINTNNLSNLMIAAIKFSNDGFVLNGNAFILTNTANAVITNVAGTSIIANNITSLGNGKFWNVAAGSEVRLTGVLTNTASSAAAPGWLCVTNGGTVRVMNSAKSANRGMDIWNGTVIVDGSSALLQADNDGFRFRPPTGATALMVLTNNGTARIGGGGNFRLGHSSTLGGAPAAAGSLSRMDLSSGLLELFGTSVSIYVGDLVAGATGVFNQNGGVVWGSAGSGNAVTIGNSVNADGTYNLNGGLLWIAKVQQGNAGATNAVFNFNGGTLKPTVSSVDFISATNSVLKLYAQSGGAILDTTNLNVTVGIPILAGSPSGGLAKLGSGTLTLTAPSTYTGATLVGNGTLAVSTRALAGGGAVTVSNGATLKVSVAAAGTALASSTLNIDATGGQVTFDLGAFSNPTTAPLLAANVTANGPATINVTGAGLLAGTFELMHFTSVNGLGNFTLGSVTPGVVATLVTNANAVSLSITSVSKLIAWTGAANANWDTSTINWKDLGNAGNPTNYAEVGGFGDLVNFDDTALANTTVTVTAAVKPVSMTVSNNTLAYSFSGAGSLTGSGSLTKYLTNSLTVGMANSYSGGTLVNAGRVRVGDNNALGNGTVTLNGGGLSSDSATARALPNALKLAVNSALGDPAYNGRLTIGGPVDFGGASITLTNLSDAVFAGGASNGILGSKQGKGTLTIRGPVTYAGASDTQDGTLIYDGATVTSSDRLIADTYTVNGIARLVITNGSTVTVTTTVGNLRSGRQASAGTNYVDLAGLYNLPNADAADGNITLEGDAAYSEMTFWPGGDFTARGVANKGGVGNTVFKFNGGILRARGSNATFFQGLSQALVQAGGANLDTANFNITVNQALLDGGGGGLNKIGSGTLTLAAANTYTGVTVVSNGILNLTGSLAGGATVVGGTLSGSGTIAGPVVVQAGAALAPGGAGGVPTTLTMQSDLTLSGNLTILVNEASSPMNDKVVVGGLLTNPGTATLTISNAGTYTGGESFQVFSQPLPNGGAIAIVPATPGPNQVWTNRLAIDGTIGVLGGGGTPADLASLTLSAGTLAPAFQAGLVNYAASVPFTNVLITLTAVSADPAATLQIIAAGTTNPLVSGTASSPIALTPGTNLIDVQVISADASTVKDYYVTVTRIQPNIVLILADDQGFSDWGCYGSEVKTPNLDSLAGRGLRLRNFFNAAMCSPTRCSLLTGLYTQQAADDPAATLPMLRINNNITIAELLQANGYHTYMTGKWHLGNGANQVPEKRGFQEIFTFASGSAGAEDSWDPTKYRFASTDGETTNIVYNSTNFYQPDAIGDYSVQFLSSHFARHTNTPFFLYMPFGSAHYPIEAPPALVDSNAPVYAAGWDALRYQRYTNMLAQGVIDPRYALSPNEGTGPLTIPQEAIPAWNSLNSDRQADLARRMGIYAAMIQKMDQNIGRVVQTLQQNGQLNNTIIIALSDNGANTSGGVFGLTGSTADPAPLTGADLANMGLSGQPQIYVGGGWAHVSNTPFRWYKRWVHKGGIATPFIISWPDGITRTNQWEDQTGHLMDVMATIVDVTGVSYPTNFNSHAVVPMQGMSLKPWFTNSTPAVARAVAWEHEGNRAYISGTWKLVNKNFTTYDGSAPGYQLELYDLSQDPSETTNVANANPALVAQLATNWNNWCNFVGDDSYLLISSLTNPPPIVNLDPVPGPNDLFVDTFNRPNGTNIDASATGMWGSCLPSLGAGSTYFKGYQHYVGYDYSGVQPALEIVTNALWANFNPATHDTPDYASENGIQYNFATPAIAAAGGFSVEMNVQGISSYNDDPLNYYAGFGVGLTQGQAASGGDVSAALAAGQVAFRGEVGGNTGVSAFFVELDYAGNVKVWSNGALLDTIPVGQNYGNLTASFACTGFTTNDTVTVTVFFNGHLIDINSADTNSVSRTFKWNQNNSNYIGLSARATDRVQIDNLAIRALPLVNDLITAYALSYGLTGTNVAPGADPDGDGVSNFGEWAFGGDPTTPDAYIASFRGIRMLPGNDFQFTFQRYINYAAVGLQYHYLVSTNLTDWTEVTPTLLSSDVNEDKTDYEVVTLELPGTVTTNQNDLFLRIQANSN